MSYDLYDQDGYLSGGPSTTGLVQLRAWATEQKLMVTLAFLDNGYTDEPIALARELEATSATGTVDSSRRALIATATHATGTLILSDGA